MRVFVTGATGFVGSAIVQELLSAGHKVLGLARSDAGAAALVQGGIEVHRGDLADPASLAAAARLCDGVIHTAFNHDFVDFAAAGAADLRVIEAMGAAMENSGRPLIVTSGTAHVGFGVLATEDKAPPADAPIKHRVPSEEHTLALAGKGVRAMVMRLPPSVHGDNDHGFVPRLINIAREKGVAAYVGEGQNRWAAVHRLDAARLYRLALEKGVAGARYHAIGDQGVATKEIAAVIGKRLNVQVVSKSHEEAGEHFGFLGLFFGLDIPASGALTQERLGYTPMHVGLIADLENGRYFEA